MPNKDINNLTNKNEGLNKPPNAPEPNPNQGQPEPNPLVKEGAKMAANTAFGPLGGQAVEAASKTKLGKSMLNNASLLNKKELSNKSNPLKGLTKNSNPIQGMMMGSSLESKNKEVEQESEEEIELSATGQMEESIKKATPYIAGCGIISFLGIIIITVIISSVMSPIFTINNVINNISSKVSTSFGQFIENMGNLAKCGYMSDEECALKQENKFYDAVKQVYNDYQSKYKVRINISLITATLTWHDLEGKVDNDLEGDFEIDEDKIDENFDEDGNILGGSDFIDFKRGEKHIKELAEQMVKDPVRVDNEGNEIAKEKWVYQIDLEKYKKYLEDVFVRKYYFNGKNDTETNLKVRQAIDEIYERVEFYDYVMGERSSHTKIYGQCSGVTVVDKQGNIINTISLEDYVAGVVSGEMYPDMNPESLKAHAVASRTFVLSSTNNCTTSIESSDSRQIYKEPYADYGIEAAEATKGLVLIYEDKVFSAMYDAFCYRDSDCPSAKVENGIYTVEYSKMPALEKHTITLSEKKQTGRIPPGQGHAFGMSTLLADQMANEGKDYEHILKYFYSRGVEIVNMVTTMTGLFENASEYPQDKSELIARSREYESIGKVPLAGGTIDLSLIYSANAGNVGECVWYARSRMLEIIYASSMNDDEKLQAYNAIANTYGHGSTWYANTTLDVFQKSPNFEEPHAGSIVSWQNPPYGHVAIIEGVDPVTGQVIMTDGWNAKGAGEKNGTLESLVEYRVRTMPYSQVKNYGGTYTFNGYVYVLG